MNIKEIKTNVDNPRIIKDDKFKKLVKSIKGFPKMMELRPIVIDENNIIQGGNMRYKALIELGYKDIPDNWVKKASDLTPEQWKEFVIKDNIGFGEWNYNLLADDWNEDKLIDWGLDLFYHGNPANDMTDDDVNINEDFDAIGESKGMQRVVFIFDGGEEAESYLKSLGVEFIKRNMAWQVNMSTRSI